MKLSHLPKRAGVGFKPEHFAEINSAPQKIGFFEVHAENYMGAGGPPHARLTKLRQDYALSIHGVGLSPGSMEALDQHHIQRLKALCGRYQPESFSEHLAWSSSQGIFYNDLLPLPYTETTLTRVAEHVDEIQNALGMQMLIENPATYLEFEESTLSETQFLSELAARTGCGLLLDLNNVFVASINHHQCAQDYIASLPLQAVRQVHLSGHAETSDDLGETLLIDAHDSPVRDPVWSLYQDLLGKTGPLATLIEWDNDVPSWAILQHEAERAQNLLERFSTRAAA